MRRIVAAPVALVALAFAAAPAVAVAADKPAPGCAGLAASDPTGDQVGTLAAAPANTDVTGLFFLTAGGKTTANITVAKLDRTLPADGTGINWYAIYDAGGSKRYVEAVIDISGALTFGYGTFDGSTYASQGETAGAFAEGPEGVISIEIPAEAGAAAGQTLGSPYANATIAIALPLVGGLVTSADTAPDDTTSGKAYTIADCPAAGAQPPPPPPASTTSAPKPSLPVRLTGRAAIRGRTISLKLTSSAPVTALRATLRRGRTVVATGQLARLGRRGTVKLKARRTIRTGTHTLTLTGTLADGRRATRTFTLSARG